MDDESRLDPFPEQTAQLEQTTAAMKQAMTQRAEVIGHYYAQLNRGGVPWDTACRMTRDFGWMFIHQAWYPGLPCIPPMYSIQG